MELQSITVLQSFFSCSNSTITGARVHAILFGRGGVPQDGLYLTRQAVSPEVTHELEEFPHRDEISRPSSCRGVLVDGGFFVILFLVHTISIDAQIYF